MTGAWVQVCRVEETLTGQPVGKVLGSSGQDRDRICVVATESGGHVAMLDRCPHRDIALSGGIVKEDILVCPGHFWRFDLTSGERTDRPGSGATLYPTRIVDGWVEALLPPVAPRQSMRDWLLSQARSQSPPEQGAGSEPARTGPATQPAPQNPSPSERQSSPVEIKRPDPEIGESIDVAGVATNYHDLGSGSPVLFIHGSGPGVSAWANWRLTLGALADEFRVIAPDVLGFGYTERVAGASYDLDSWTDHLIGFMDALGLARVSLVGNSFGGALALRLATRHPERIDRLVLMGSVGVPFELTRGLDTVWGFEPSLVAMRGVLDVFAHDRSLIDDDLARLRLAAAVRPGVHEAYSAMFPAPRQTWIDAMTVEDTLIRSIDRPTLVIHGRDDQVIPMSTSLRLLELIDDSQLHVFGRCGHWVQIEHTVAFNALLRGFLS